MALNFDSVRLISDGERPKSEVFNRPLLDALDVISSNVYDKGEVDALVAGGGGGGVSTDDPRLSDAREWIAETVTQVDAEAGTSTERKAWTAQRVRQAVVAWWNGVSSSWGRNFVGSADAAAGRTALGLDSLYTLTSSGTSIPNATETTVGGVKARLDGTTLYLTTDGTNP